MSKKIAVITLGAFLFGLCLASGLTEVSAKSCGGSKGAGEGGGIGMANPAAVYCIEMGYEYRIIDDSSGQRGICIFPDRSQCDAWDFLKGKCGQEYSYCAKQGYDIETRNDGQNPFSMEYAVCISQEGELVGSVTALMDLSRKCEKGSTALPLENDGSVAGTLLGLDIPLSFSWADFNGHNWMTSVKDQGSCGSCWAFATVGVVEAVHNIRYSDPDLDLNLSEQYLVSDCFDYGSCCGGWPSYALWYFYDEGVPDELCMPYVDGSGCTCDDGDCDANCNYRTGDSCSDATCADRCSNWESRLVKISDFGGVPADRQTIREYIVTKGPLAVTMGIGDAAGGYFDSAERYHCTNDEVLNHAVIIVGYDYSRSTWIVKNSWGTGSGFGYNGYFQVAYGECGIESAVHYADKVDCGCTVAGNVWLPDTLNCPGDGLDIVADGTKLNGYGTGAIIGSSSGRGIKIIGVDNVKVEGLNVKGFDYGIYVTYSHGDTLINNSADSNTYGFYLYTHSDSNYLSGNTASFDSCGFRLFASGENTLTGNSSDSNTYGFYLYHADANYLSTNTANSNTYGFYLDLSDENTLTGNTADFDSYGFYSDHADSTNTLRNNTANNNVFGICLGDAYADDVSGNTANNNEYGIFLVGKNNVLAGNVADSNRGGMWIGGDSNYVDSNAINHNTAVGLLMGGFGNTLHGNIVSGNPTGLGLSYANNNYITGNDFIDNTTIGAGLYSSQDNIFWGNEFANSGYNAFEMTNDDHNHWNLADTGNYWSDCCTNPGYPDRYEIPGNGGGVDSFPQCPNCAPCAFSLLWPEESAFVSPEVAFDWDDAQDLNPEDTVRYDLLISTSLEFHPDSTIIHDSLLTSSYSDTLDVGEYHWKAKAYDDWGAETWSTQTWTFYAFRRGDANGDGAVALGDAIYLLNYLFKNGDPPFPLEAGDANCDDTVQLGDAIYLLNYLFKNGPPPGCP